MHLSEPTRRGAVVLLLISVIAGAAALYVPAGLLVLPALWACAGARTKPAWIALPAALYAAGAFWLYTPLAAAGFILMTAGGALALCLMQTRRMTNAYTVLTLAGILLVGLYTAVCLKGLLSGEGAFAATQAGMDQTIALYRAALPAASGANADAVQMVNEYLTALSKAVPTYLVAVLCAAAGVGGLSNLLFFRLFLRKHKEIAISPMREFRQWSLPRSMVFGLFALLICSVVLEWTQWQYADRLSATVNMLVGMPLVLQGLCVVDFLLSRSKRNVTASRVVTYSLVGVGVLLSLAQMPLMLLGCFEQLFRFRARAQGLPPRTL